MFIANLNLGAGKLPQKSVKQCNLELIHKSLDCIISCIIFSKTKMIMVALIVKLDIAQKSDLFIKETKFYTLKKLKFVA